MLYGWSRQSNYWTQIYIPYQPTPRLLLSDSVLVLTGPTEGATPPCLGAAPPPFSWFARADPAKELLLMPPTDCRKTFEFAAVAAVARLGIAPVSGGFSHLAL